MFQRFRNKQLAVSNHFIKVRSHGAWLGESVGSSRRFHSAAGLAVSTEPEYLFFDNGREAQAEPRDPELIIPTTRGSASRYGATLAEPRAVGSHLKR